MEDFSVSNFNYVIPTGADKALRNGSISEIEHCARDHWGRITFRGGMFHEEVWRHNVPICVVSGGSISEVFREVNSIYGER